MNALAAARALAAFWPEPAMVAPETGLSVCIETTRLIVDVFHAVGVKNVTPLPCALYAYNPEATRAIMTGTKAGKGAMRVEVSPEAIPASKSRGFRGHLVVDHPQFILDLVLPGVIRSVGATGFDGLGTFIGVKHESIQFVDGGWVTVSPNTKIAVRYEPRRRLASWRNSDAWRGDPDPSVVQILADALAGTESDDDA